MVKKRNVQPESCCYLRIASLLLGITSKGLEIVDCKFFARSSASSAAAARSWGCGGAGLGLVLARDDRDTRVLIGSRVKNAAPAAGPRSDASASSLPIDIGSLSAREIELSEDYTCVISHGPNPKTVHIFGDCILESLPASHCFSCNRQLEQIEDREILLDEEMEKVPTADPLQEEIFL